jgi:uncharacterized YigZ family protein
MVTTDTYISISGESRGSYREKASRFIAVAYPVSSEEEVKRKLEELRKEYYDANHHCFAYRLGQSGEAYRYSDDGEPSGSAGRPIHGQLLSKGLSDVLVVVVRYFGGTKLGVPGLIHAYRTAAATALDQAEKVEKVLKDMFEIVFEYGRMNDAMRILKDCGAAILQIDSGEECRITFTSRRSKSEEIQRRLSKHNVISRCLYVL